MFFSHYNIATILTLYIRCNLFGYCRLQTIQSKVRYRTRFTFLPESECRKCDRANIIQLKPENLSISYDAVDPQIDSIMYVRCIRLCT